MMNLRKATPDDAPFIARMVMMALHMDDDEVFMADMSRVAGLDDTIYSWHRCTLAECDGQPVGLCLAYDGGLYHAMREVTFPMFRLTDDSVMTQQDETGAGEYYIDSLAVLPEFRGRGIGGLLLTDAIGTGQSMALTPGLLVLPDNEPAQRLYGSKGFRYHSEQAAFGHAYQKWRVE